MRDLKFIVPNNTVYESIIKAFKEKAPYVEFEKGLSKRYLKYLYLTENVLSGGINNLVFNSSSNIEATYEDIIDKAHETLEEIEFGDIMIDIETLGTNPGDVVLSIGAVEFNRKTGATGREFYRTIDLKSSLGEGFKINPNTLKWWLKQDREVFNQALDTPIVMGHKVETIIQLFLEWFLIMGWRFTTIKVWGNSARFDLGMLEPYFDKVGLRLPWEHYNERDVRTLVDFAPEVKQEVIERAKALGADLHNPIVDCKLQIEYCTQIFNKIKVN